ncbi:MAG: hypothetical protein ACXWR1_17530 [Bdellovibrionota bacterium]
MRASLVKFGLLLLLAPAAAQAGASSVTLNPVFTPDNGLSCGRPVSDPEGVECVAPQCYDTAVSREFNDWASFEKNFFREEAKRSGLTTGPSDFSDICTGHKYFTPDEKELFWLDFLRITVGLESSYQWLDAFDDMIGGKIMTERGFFQVGRADCAFLPEVRADYCAVHWPKINARCGLTIMARLTRGGGKTLDALARGWGSMRSAAKNSEGGRREVLQKSFMMHPACKYTGPAAAAVPQPQARTRSRGRQARQAPAAPVASPAADDPNRPKYDRLRKEMYPEYSDDPTFSRGKIIPSYVPRKNVNCDNLDGANQAKLDFCKRVTNWDHYKEIDKEFADKMQTQSP